MMGKDTNEQEELAYQQGKRQAWLSMLQTCLRELGYESAQKAAWISEREEAIATLRGICSDFGDNDWPDNLNLSDVIEKHLARPLYAKENEATTLLQEIAVLDPICASRSGDDAHCFFCGCLQEDVRPVTDYLHNQGCIWVSARALLNESLDP